MQIIRMISKFPLVVLSLALLYSPTEALEPSKDLQAPKLEPTIPLFKAPPIEVKPEAEPTNIMRVSEGVIQRRGPEHGAYHLNPAAGEKAYSLKSDIINLEQYVGKRVRVSGELINAPAGDAGLQYMNVRYIELLSR